MSATEIRSLNGYKLNDETARSNIEKLRTESQQYTNTKISQLINSAPTTLDTLGEIAAAMVEHATVVEALDTAIGSKADKNYVNEVIKTIEVPVNSVNGKTGEVTLVASDIGAMSANNPVGTGSFSMGRKSNTTIGNNSYAMGNNVSAIGINSHAEGHLTAANATNSHAEGYGTKANADNSHAEGYSTEANAPASHAEGLYTVANGEKSHAEGWSTEAKGKSSHAEGYLTKANGDDSHAEGYLTKANGKSSHAEGNRTIANKYYSHAEGNSTVAYDNSSHSEGSSTIAFGTSAHSEGQGDYSTIYISGEANSLTYNIVNESDLKYVTIHGIILLDNIGAVITAIDETNLTITLSNTLSSEAISNATVSSYYGGIAYGQMSHVEGKATIATDYAQHVQGKYNIVDARKQYAHIVGNGYSNSKSNAHTLDWSGNAWFAGDVYVGSTSGTNKDEGSKRLATEEFVQQYIENNLPEQPDTIGINQIYPVGSIYMSVINTSPATFIGGTWESINDVFLLAAGTTYAAGSTGGEAEHVLTTNEIPSHSHTYTDIQSAPTYDSWCTDGSSSSTLYVHRQSQQKTSGSTGEGGAHNNMPPYLTVYMWKRVA